VWLGTGEVFEEGECSLPPLEFETTAVWIDLPLIAKKKMDAAGHDITASIHAVNHVLVSISPLFAEVTYCNCSGHIYKLNFFIVKQLNSDD
jgi:ATP-dependent helicase YprA (DUF1998 family)